MTHFFRKLYAPLLTALAAFAIDSPALADGLPITISAGVRDPIYSHLYVAVRKGYLEEEGLQPKLTVTGSGSRTAQLLATGQADVVFGNPEHVLVISEQGRPTVMLAAVDQRNTFGNILTNANSGIKTMADLKGKAIGITATGGGAYYYANYLFSRSGLARNDITWLNLGSVSNMMGALRSNRAAALVASLSMMETARADKSGQVLFDSRDTNAWNAIFGGPMPSSVVYALAANVGKQPDLYRRFVRAVIKADNFIKQSSPQDIAKVIEPEMGGQSLDSLTHAISAYKEIYWRSQGLRIGEEEFNRWKKFAAENQLIPATGKYDYADLVRDVGTF